ncbi:hypothetical protein [Haloplanus halobius]|uniref:hypothetical protein n=1 Tax=Haloplanus halobius TaxID=2934938 RepID=UPI002010B709|nr:hypothetical protein [Haloplanus sp. XH21]
MTPVGTVWDELFGQVGDPLRAVTQFRNAKFETRMRDDVRAQYTRAEDRTLVDRIIIDRLLSKPLEEEFKCGALTGSVHIFEDAQVLVQAHPKRPKTGYLVSIDRTENVRLGDLECCFEYLRTEAFGGE